MITWTTLELWLAIEIIIEKKESVAVHNGIAVAASHLWETSVQTTSPDHKASLLQGDSPENLQLRGDELVFGLMGASPRLAQDQPVSRASAARHTAI